MSDNHRWQKVCQLDDLSNGGAIEFILPTGTGEPDTVALRGFVLLHNGRPRAFVNRCPHLGIELNWSPGRFLDADHCFVQCSTHGALFLPDSGECIAGPCQGEALTPLELTERPDGIHIKPPE
ncbi:MAG: Rieske (2Fe-2S) protein [Pseudomonadota bacterium]